VKRAFLIVLAAATAHADVATWPTAVIERPLVLDPGMVEIRGDTVDVDLSAGSASPTVSLAPSVFYGVAAVMTVGITHDSIVGPPGLCLTGASHGCPAVYNNVNLEGFHSIARGGALEVATHPQLAFVEFTPDVLVGLRVAVTLRYRVGNLAVLADPGVLFGFNDRGDGKNATELVSVPLALEAQATDALEIHLTSGLTGSLSSPSFGNSFAIPVGAGATYALGHALDVGADVELANALGHLGTLDRHAAIARIAWRH
jgi:hypothetical protein